jgi:PilZ domain
VAEPHPAHLALALAHPKDDDQRRASRIPVDLPARFRSDTESVDGRAANLSQGGIRFIGSAPRLGPSLAPIFDEADSGHVVLEIDLPDDEAPLHLDGEVCWSELGPTRAVGIRFTHVGRRERARLANFVIRRACESIR